MKTRAISFTAMLCLLIVASAAYAAENPNMGTWKLNEAKSTIPAGAPKNTTVVYSAASGGMTKVTTDGVGSSGQADALRVDRQVRRQAVSCHRHVSL